MFQSTVRETMDGVWLVWCGVMTGMAGGRQRAVDRGRSRDTRALRSRGSLPCRVAGWVLVLLVSLIWLRPASAQLAPSAATPKSLTLTGGPGEASIKFNDNGDILQTWRILADSFSFDIRDETFARTPFSILPNTPNSTLFLQRDSFDVGNVGINGVADNGVHLQVTAEAMPIIRMAQSASPFYDWDIRANQFNWFVEDNGAGTTPFVIKAGAPSSTLYLAQTGNIGVGTATPAADSRVDIRSSLTNGLFMKHSAASGHFLRVENTAGAFRSGVESSGNAQFGAMTAGKGLNLLAGGSSKVTISSAGKIGIGNPPPTVGAADVLLVSNGAHLTTGGVWVDNSSRATKQDIHPISSAQARETVRALQPVGFRYKSEPDEQYVGFIAEDVPELVATHDRKGLAPMDIVGVLTKVVQDQDKLLQNQNRQLADERQRNEQQQKSLEQQRKTLAEHQQMLAKLTRRLTALEQRSRAMDDSAP